MTNGIIFCVLFNISHFGPTVCSEVMSKKHKKDSGEESHSKIETNDEFDCAMQRKGLQPRNLLLHQKSKENQNQSQNLLSLQAEK